MNVHITLTQLTGVVRGGCGVRVPRPQAPGSPKPASCDHPTIIPTVISTSPNACQNAGSHHFSSILMENDAMIHHFIIYQHLYGEL